MQSPKLTLEDIVLLRLWRGKAREQGMTRSDLARDTKPFSDGDKHQVYSAIDRLSEDGGVRTVGGQRGRVEATPEGIKGLRSRVVVSDDWSKMKWNSVWSRALTATVLGRDARHADKLALKDGLCALLLLEAAGEEWKPGFNMNYAVAKFISNYLGAGTMNIDRVRRALVQRAMQGQPVLPGKAVVRNRSAPGADGNQTPGGPQGGTAVEPPDLAAFARTAIETARRCPTGRVGDVEVFIASVWEHGRQLDPPAWLLVLETFKSRLAEAFKQGLVRLTRCDLAPAFDADDVARSEVRRFGQPFHFLLTLDP